MIGSLRLLFHASLEMQENAGKNSIGVPAGQKSGICKKEKMELLRVPFFVGGKRFQQMVRKNC